MNDEKQYSADGGDVYIRAGNAGPHGKGADITIIGGTIRAGDGGNVAINSPSQEPISSPQRWHEKSSWSLVATIFAVLLLPSAPTISAGRNEHPKAQNHRYRSSYHP